MIKSNTSADTESLAVDIKNLYVSYGQIKALSGVNLEVKSGEYLGIIGPNGGGKSTLIKALLGLVPISNGSVLLFGNSPQKNRRYAGYVPQITAVDKHFPISVYEVVLSGCLQPRIKLFAKFAQKDKELAYKLLEKVGLSDLAERQVSQLSGGEFQKMLIARALAAKPKLLVLDEPTASVDAVSRNQIFSLLEELNKEMTIILVTHDLLAVSSQVTKLACLNRTLVYHGEPEINENIVNSLYGCPVDLIAHGVPHRVLKEHSHKEGESGC